MSFPIADAGPRAAVPGRQGRELDMARRKALYAGWRVRSRQIHLYRRILPAMIGGVLLTLGGWVLYNTVAWRFTDAARTGGAQIRMVNPKFYGRGSDDAPYLISAASALRDDRDFQRVVLDKPVFVINLNSPIQTTLTALTGVYREDTRILRLEKDLVVDDKRGYNFKSQRAVVDTITRSVEGDSPIEGTGPLGRIAASSYAVTDGGERIVFRGAVRTRIDRPSRR